MCAPARMEKQIINFGISFQLKVTSIQHKKEGTKTRSSCRKLRVSFSRYAKRCFFITERKPRRSHLLFRFSKVFFSRTESSYPINCKSQLYFTHKASSHDHKDFKDEKSCFEAFYAKSHLCVLLFSFEK